VWTPPGRMPAQRGAARTAPPDIDTLADVFAGVALAVGK
jgi:hypothetical protein